MLLEEIKPSTNTMEKKYRNAKVLGSGAHGAVYDNGDNTVTKETGTKGKYAQFVEYVMKNQDNPFFPRIIDASVEDTEEHGDVLYVTMEKLIPIGRENIKDASTALFRSIGVDDNDMEPSNWNTTFDKDSMDVTDEEYENMRHRRGDNKLAQNFNSEPLEQLLRRSKNPQFNKAIAAMHQIAGPSKYLDLHGGNWMVRLTKHGPQLVMVDPIAG